MAALISLKSRLRRLVDMGDVDSAVYNVWCPFPNLVLSKMSTSNKEPA